MCFNVFIIYNHEKGTSMEIRSCDGGEGCRSCDDGEREGREKRKKKKKSVRVCFIVSPLTVFL